LEFAISCSESPNVGLIIPVRCLAMKYGGEPIQFNVRPVEHSPYIFCVHHKAFVDLMSVVSVFNYLLSNTNHVCSLPFYLGSRVSVDFCILCYLVAISFASRRKVTSLSTCSTSSASFGLGSVILQCLHA
jgi:hypothetical protein